MKGRTLKTTAIFFLLYGLILFLPRPSYADCVNPVAPAGRIDYFSAATEQVFKYCTGTSWVPWAAEPIVGAAAPKSSGAGADTLDALNDVNAASPSDGQCLKFVSASAEWQSGTCSGGAETDPKVGTLTNGKWCTTDGSAVNCTSDAPGGTPAGNSGEVQFNDSNAFAASPNLFWDNAQARLGINDNTPDAALDVVGDIHYTGVITDVSDIRLKENIRPLQSSLARLAGLQGLSYEMKDDLSAHTEYGFSAQQVQQLYPALVYRNDDSIGTLSVNYIGLIAPMVEAIKELKAENERLRARLEIVEQSTARQIEEQ